MGRKPFTPTLTPEQIENKSIRKQELLKILFQPDFISLEEKIFNKGWEDKIEHYFEISLYSEKGQSNNTDYKSYFNNLCKDIDKLYKQKENIKRNSEEIEERKKQEKELKKSK